MNHLENKLWVLEIYLQCQSHKDVMITKGNLKSLVFFLYAGFAKLVLYVAAVSSLIGIHVLLGKLKCFF